jgi:hypothetical protein
MRAAGTVGMIGQLPGAGLAAVGTARSLGRSGTSHPAPTWSWTGLATAIRSQLPDGAPGLIHTAALEALALPAVVQNGVLTLRVADVLPATMAAEAQRRLAAGGVRGRLVLDLSQPL